LVHSWSVGTVFVSLGMEMKEYKVNVETAVTANMIECIVVFFVYLGMKEMNNKIQNTIEKVSNSFPSLFSREDVIKLLTDLNSELQSEAPQFEFNKETLLTVFRESFSEKDFDAVVETDNIEFSLGWDKKIEIDSVPIDEDYIVMTAVDTLEAVWNALEGKEN
jgi:hypothetical protein